VWKLWSARANSSTAGEDKSRPADRLQPEIATFSAPVSEARLNVS